jgi:hypothetical protein
MTIFIPNEPAFLPPPPRQPRRVRRSACSPPCSTDAETAPAASGTTATCSRPPAPGHHAGDELRQVRRSHLAFPDGERDIIDIETTIDNRMLEEYDEIERRKRFPETSRRHKARHRQRLTNLVASVVAPLSQGSQP